MKNLTFWFWSITIFIITVILHINTFAGLDTDFQTYSLVSKLFHYGQIPYKDFYADQKPPIFYYLLLPGNILGGKLISFFVVNLFIVGMVGSIVFYAGSVINRPINYQRGLWSWAIFQTLTVAQFLSYGNLNGSIVYPVIGLNIIAFLQLIYIKQLIEKQKPIFLFRIFILGVISGITFGIRFSFTAIILFMALVFYLLLNRYLPWKKIFQIAWTYILGFLITIFVALAIIGFPLKEMYEHLIVWNFQYSNWGHSSSSLIGRFTADFYPTISGLIKYTLPLSLVSIPFILIVLCILFKRRWLIGLVNMSMLIGLLFILNHESELPIILGRYSLKFFLIIIIYIVAFIGSLFILFFFNKVILSVSQKRSRADILNYFWPYENSWLLLYFIIELFTVVLQGTGAKNYPFFPTFVPLVLMASLLFNNVILIKKPFRYDVSYKRSNSIISGLFSILLVTAYCFALFYPYSNRNPELTTISRIKSVKPTEQLFNMMRLLFRHGKFSDEVENTWPEQKLIDAIKMYSNGTKDYYNLYFGAYLYLETDKIPPIRIYSYDECWWSGWGTEEESENELINDLIQTRPKVITLQKELQFSGTTTRFPISVKNILLKYHKVGTYYTNYGGDIDLYILE